VTVEDAAPSSSDRRRGKTRAPRAASPPEAARPSRHALPPISPSPTSLPDVEDALASHGACVLQAPPGAGKTTLVPLRLLEAPWLAGRASSCWSPRRLAARAAATRIAELLGEPVGRDRRLRDALRAPRRAGHAPARRHRGPAGAPAPGRPGAGRRGPRGLRRVPRALARRRPRAWPVPRGARCAPPRPAAARDVGDARGRQGRPPPGRRRPGGPQRGPAVPGRGGASRPRPGATARGAGGAGRPPRPRGRPGDVLAFLPGGREIGRARATWASRPGVRVLPLHGDLPRAAQDEAIRPAPRGPAQGRPRHQRRRDQPHDRGRSPASSTAAWSAGPASRPAPA
jgi:ATP-dependent helicase HrpB